MPSLIRLYVEFFEMKKRAWLAGIALVLYCGFIFFLSSLPASSISSYPFSDKAKHFFLYLGLGFIFSYFLKNLKWDISWFAICTAALFFSFIYGLSDEIHQLFVPGRTFDLIDLIADSVGGISGGIMIFFLFEINRSYARRLTNNK